MTILNLGFSFKEAVKVVGKEVIGFAKFIIDEGQPKKPRKYDHTATIFLTCPVGGTMVRSVSWDKDDKFAVALCYACQEKLTMQTKDLMKKGKANEQICGNGHYYHCEGVRSNNA